MNEEETELFNKISLLKRERDFLYVIFEEVDELLSVGYNGSFRSEQTAGLSFAVKEYKKWIKNENKTR